MYVLTENGVMDKMMYVFMGPVPKFEGRMHLRVREGDILQVAEIA